MATNARLLSRTLRSSPISSTFKSEATQRFATAPRQAFQQRTRRGYRSFRAQGPSWSSAYVYGGAAAIFAAAGVIAINQRPNLAESRIQVEEASHAIPSNSTSTVLPAKGKYQEVYNAIAEKIIEEDEYDDGSYAPVILRLGWHCSGTYDAATGTGGSNGATMRFPAEGGHGANAGLENARDFLEPIKKQFPWISYSDLWTLAAVCALQEMGGPDVPWRPGRLDKDASSCTPDGRLPDGAKSQNHVRRIFGRMGFDDREMVALIGAHAVGRCHANRSGFDGPWTFSPITFTNEFYKLLLNKQWYEKSWSGPRQFENDSSKSLMMLPTDKCLVDDKDFKPYVEKYAADENVYFDDFSQALTKLFELGVPFASGEDARMVFERTE